MGPAIIFDKSALESMGRPTLYEANRYFYTVIPDVLLYEILADLTLVPEHAGDPKARVAMLSRKISFHSACASLNFRKMAINDLLGNYVPMDRRPVVDAATVRVVKTTDGQIGTMRDVRPENEALLKWGGGVFKTDDFEFAAKWREALAANGLSEMTSLPKLDFTLQSLEQVNTLIDTMMIEPEFHLPLIDWFMAFIGYDETIRKRVRFRWSIAINKTLSAFAPYAAHCIRVYVFYYLAARYNLLPTKPSTLIDLEYFCHAPFAHVLCSSDDKLHKRMAPFILGSDQSYAEGSELRLELNQLAEIRKSDKDVFPLEDSLIGKLWLKHWKRAPEPDREMTEDEIRRINEEVRPFLEALREQPASEPSKSNFPKPLNRM